MTAEQIFNEQINSYEPGQETFLVNLEEFSILVKAGGEWSSKDLDNGDGTFFNKVVYRGKNFVTSTNKKQPSDYGL